MQTLTRTMKEAIRGSYQAPLAKIEIFEQDGRSAGEILDVLDVVVDGASSRSIPRTIKISLDNKDGIYTPDPNLYDRNLLWYNKKMKVYYGLKTTAGDEWLPQGLFNITDIRPDVNPDGVTIEIEGQDRLQELIEDQFDENYNIEVAVYDSPNFALASQGGSATASSFISAGDEIQDQSSIYYAETYATVNGLKTPVRNENEASPQGMLNQRNGWKFDFTPAADSVITEIEAEIFIDLKDPLQLQQIQIQMANMTELTDFLWISPDNAAWKSYTSPTVSPSEDVRFIRFKVRKRAADPDGKWRLGISKVQIKTAKTFSPSLAIDGDIHNTDWRPRATDPDPVITFDLGQSRMINVIYTYWGRNSFDFWNRVNYFIETSANGSNWSRIQDWNGYDENSSFYGEVEHVINPVTVRYVRINIKGKSGVVMLRHIRIMEITAEETIRDLMTTVLQTTSIQEYEIPFTRRYIERKMAEAGDEKAAFLASLARAANWETGTDENGVYRAYYRDIDPIRYAWHYTVEDDNIFSFGFSLGNDIKNVIVVTNESSGSKAISGKAVDDNPLSPTSISNLGRRVIKYSGESYNSQEICDRIAQERLFTKTRPKHQTSLPVTGNPAIQMDDVILVTVKDAKVEKGYYLVTGYETRFRAETAEFDTRLNISQL